MRFKGITRNVVVLGWVSFFTDLASEMLYPVIPLFLAGTLGASTAVIGLIEGLAEGVSSGLRWVGGAMSDRWRRRKPFVAAGYTISAFSKPVMGLAAIAVGWPLFLIGRIADRLGKSARTAARDALIVDSTDPAHRGAAFGFHRAMDTCGAVLGPLVALLIVGLLAGWGSTFAGGWGSSGPNVAGLGLHWLFIIALVPGLISAALSTFAVQEKLPQAPPGAGRPKFLQKYPPALWRLIAATALFSLGNSSDTFLLLRSSELGLSFGHVVLAFALYNAVYAAMAGPLGRLSDRVGRKPLIIGGWIVYAGVYLGFAGAGGPGWPWALLAVYGLYQAMSEGITKAMIGDLVPQEQRAGAIGLLYTVVGICQFVASVLCGLLWKVSVPGTGLMAAFAIGAAFALLAIPVLASVPHDKHPAA